MESPNMNMLSNSIKLQILLNRGNAVLRNLFLERWSKYSGSDWDSSSSVKRFTTGIGKKVYDKLQRIQKTSVESGDLNQWDLTTLTDIFMLTDFPTDPKTKQAKALERSKLEELKRVRNKLAHAPSFGTEDELFDILWKNASQVLIFFGCLSEDLDKIKFSANLSAYQDENSSGHVNKANSEEATKLKDEANGFYKNGEFEKAIELYSKAISFRGLLDSELAVLYSNRSIAYLSSAGKNKRHVNSEEIHCALQDGKEAVKLNPTWFRGYLRTAKAYFELGKFREALEFFDNALILSSGTASEELRQARDNCRMKIGQEERHEHLDPTSMPRSEADQLKEIQTRYGVPATETDLAKAKKLVNDMIPGYAYVREANDIMTGAKATTDPELAAKLYAKGASLGNAEGMYNLGLLYKSGMGITQDLNMYIKFMKQAASQPHKLPGRIFPNVGVAEAEHSLGLAYEEGIGVNQDVAEAAEWYKNASDHGCSNASNNLGFLCMSGQGMPLNIERGVQYWKLAASQGNQLAMYSLAIHYLEREKDPREAREWHGRALKHGNLEAKLDKVDFEKKLNELEKENQKIESDLLKWEKESRLSGNGMTYNSRLKRMARALEPGMTNVMEGIESIYLAGKEQTSSTTSSSLHQFDPIVLEKYANNGSRTASQLLASMSHFDNVCELLMGSDLQKTRAQIIHELAECFRICELVVQLYPDCKEELCGLVAEALEQSVENTDLDKDARICFAYLQMDSLDHILIFTKHSKRKYPNEKAFHLHHSSMCGFLQKYDLGVKETEKALKMFPKDVDLLYSRAVNLRLLESTPRDVVIQAYEEFLSVAPPDHRKVPESYYSISNAYFLKYAMKTTGFNGGTKTVNPATLSQEESVELFNKMEEYYELGLNAEKLQLPCFLPYDSTPKAMIENRQPMIPAMKAQFSKKIEDKSDQSSNSIVKSQVEAQVQPTGQIQIIPEQNYITLSDPNRTRVIKSHREHLLQLRALQVHGKNKIFMSNTMSAANSQRVPVNLAGLKPITFHEMDTQVDKVYEECVVQVTSIDDAGFGLFPSIRLVLEDENRNVYRGFIYNFSETDGKIVQQKLGFGAKMSILNPYMRLAQDGQFGVRVDDPASLFLHSPATLKSCRFCLKENADLHCGNCKRAYYCSRKCQEMDWKVMKHKLICVSLEISKTEM